MDNDILKYFELGILQVFSITILTLNFQLNKKCLQLDIINRVRLLNEEI